MVRLSRLAALLGLAACNAVDATPAPELGMARALEAPAPVRSGEPFLAPAREGVLLSWIEATSDSTHALRYARLAGGEWSPAVTVAEGSYWFVNWADFPSIVELPDGSLAAHFLQRSGPGRYSYDVWLTHSSDGVTWSPPVRPHRDGTPTEHGFVSLFPVGDALGAVWLDGRQFADVQAAADGHGGHGAEMSLRYTTLARDGALGEEVALDLRTCDCCQTAVALTDAGPLLVYRDRSESEIRDIAATRLVNGQWTEPIAVHADGWQIDACPVNGPAIAARGQDAVVAWFTAAQDTPRVRVAFTADAGVTFSAPVRIDDGAPVGRVAVLLDESGDAFVSWLENAGDDAAEIRVRRVTREGIAGPPVTVASASARRASGFPRMVRNGDALLFAWTEPGDSARVRMAEVALVR